MRGALLNCACEVDLTTGRSTRRKLRTMAVRFISPALEPNHNGRSERQSERKIDDSFLMCIFSLALITHESSSPFVYIVGRLYTSRITLRFITSAPSSYQLQFTVLCTFAHSVWKEKKEKSKLQLVVVLLVANAIR